MDHIACNNGFFMLLIIFEDRNRNQSNKINMR